MSDPVRMPQPENSPPATSHSASAQAVPAELEEGGISASRIAQIVRWIRRVLGWSTLSYVAGLVLVLLALERFGERLWLFGILLYAPPQIFLLPLLLLTPACLLFHRRLVGWHCAAVVFLLFGYMNFRWSRPKPASAGTITAVTFNLGESNRAQFLDFIDREKPDVVLLQDTGGRGGPVAAKLPGNSIVNIGQFCFISRFPLGKPAFVDVKSNGQPVAARCEVVIAGQPTALYCVHLPTPRRELSRFLGGRRILGDLAGRPHREPGFGNYREWLANRIELARSLARVFAAEPLPMIVGGDFNTPDHGYIYHLFTERMTDAFTHSGRGWGLTFPGHTRNPVSLFGPWLRIDYFFSGRGWKAIECRPEPGRKSQHKAVLARFEPKPLP